MLSRSFAGIGKTARLRLPVSRPLCRFMSTEPEIVLKDKSRPMRIERELPDINKGKLQRRLGFVGFLVTIGVSFLAIVNYEKTQSPIVTNSLYQLRRSPATRDLLGDHVDFDGLVPWVYGQLNQVAGNINIKFYVKGSKGVTGVVTLVASRESKLESFMIHEWCLTVGDTKVDLLEEGGAL
ncbi:HHR252Wp [Eremothecium sinecaudum]|uniref:HHR252Wp n=1 Tax=Eremothecium sinecaudum TaxID=45286 RepID=A0A0X8HWJ4_9SACH|nr:HHR252Wp [Eremothecium sinecaudum]AMD23021.1 HHR252Wp [Eremothecium sinecaudum]